MIKHSVSRCHTEGIPGRNEFDETQELNYAAISRAIAETGCDGFIGQEYVPTSENPFEFRLRAVELCSG